MNAEVVASFREAIKAYPQWLDNSDVFRNYYIMSKRASSTEDLDYLKSYVNDLATEIQWNQRSTLRTGHQSRKRYGRQHAKPDP